jgi:hypothetical protein
MTRLGASVVAIAIAAVTVTTAAAQNFDGITIITFDRKGGPGGEAIADGDHIVTFVSARGTYASVATNFRGIRRGCLAEAVPGMHPEADRKAQEAFKKNSRH